MVSQYHQDQRMTSQNHQDQRMVSQINQDQRITLQYYQDFHFFPQKGQQIPNPNYNPLIDDEAEEFLSSPAGSSSSSQLTNSQMNLDVPSGRSPIRQELFNEIIQNLDN